MAHNTNNGTNIVSQVSMGLSQRFNRLLMCDMYYSKSSWSERHKLAREDGLIAERLINHRRLSETMLIDFKQTMNRLINYDYTREFSNDDNVTSAKSNLDGKFLFHTRRNPNYQEYDKQTIHKECQTEKVVDDLQIKLVKKLQNKIVKLTKENIILSNQLLRFKTPLFDC